MKFKITSDDYSATTSLDLSWQAKPFMNAVVKPVVMKLNRRPNKEPVDHKYLERVEVDGVAVAPALAASGSVAQVVRPGAQVVALTFGLAPPTALRFSVQSDTSEVSFTITLDAKFMKKSFFDAVVAPFVHYYNKRVMIPVEAKNCVQVNIDGVKAPGATGTTVHKKTAYEFLGRSPAEVKLFFSWEAVSRYEKLAAGKTRGADGGYSRLAFKIPISKSTDCCNEKVLNYDHAELTYVDGAELAKKFREYAPLDKLKHLYLEHNALGDGIGALATALNRKNTPNLKRLVLANNRITSAGCVALAKHWGASPSEERIEDITDEKPKTAAPPARNMYGAPAPSGGPAKASSKEGDRRCPDLDMLVLEDNRIGDEGALALGVGVEGGSIFAHEIRMHGNPAITPATREKLCGADVVQQGHGVHFRFEKCDTGSCFTQEGDVVPELRKDPRSRALEMNGI